MTTLFATSLGRSIPAGRLLPASVTPPVSRAPADSCSCQGLRLLCRAAARTSVKVAWASHHASFRMLLSCISSSLLAPAAA
eukprot:12576521-Heterocapsa_arctica.AAC.1